MKKKIIISLLLAGCCLLSGCSKTASDEDVFGNRDPDPNGSDPVVQQTPADEDSAASAEPGGDDQESAAPGSDPAETDTPPETGAPEGGPSAPGSTGGNPPSAGNSSAPGANGQQGSGTPSVTTSSAGGSTVVTPNSSVQVPNSGKHTSAPATPAPVASTGPFIDEVPMSEGVNLGEELIPMSAAPAAVPTVLTPVASGTAVKSGGGAEIDYSNSKDGYVMARFAASNSKRLRVQVAGPTTTYTYDLPTGKWVTFPLSDGNGTYKTTVLQNTTGKKYAVLASASFQVALADEFAPFLRPNQYVNYEGATNTVAMAANLTRNVSKPLDKVGAVYNYVVSNLTYDRAKAASVTSGYLPDLDSVLASKTGICFDYAALMTGMLRSQGIPCKLVVGYAGTTYHAWVSVWTQETGWVDNAIYFDGTTWHRMDPTFASSGNSSSDILQYIGNGSNYTVKYLY